MIDMVSAALGSVGQGPQLFLSVIAMEKRTLRTVQIVLSLRCNQAQWYPVSGEAAHKP